jgi:nucleoid-associated protein YgaU
MATQTTVVGGDLYRLAAQTYGDATQWYRIAAANGLGDPFVPGPVTLTIPAPTTQPGNGGILGGNS